MSGVPCVSCVCKCTGPGDLPRLQRLTLDVMVVMWCLQYLDENKQLILAILDNQNLGKLNECATYASDLPHLLMSFGMRDIDIEMRGYGGE